MEEYVIYGMSLVGWGALCFVVCKFMVWPFVKGLDEGLNGGVDEGEAYEAELQATLEGLQRQLNEIVKQIGNLSSNHGLEIQKLDERSGYNKKMFDTLNERVVELEKMHSHYEKKFSEIYSNLKADNDSLTERYRQHNELNQIVNDQVVIIARLQESFDLHRESFERLLEVLGGTAKKKIITKGKSR